MNRWLDSMLIGLLDYWMVGYVADGLDEDESGPSHGWMVAVLVTICTAG
jgi:hypothetical protein